MEGREEEKKELLREAREKLGQLEKSLIYSQHMPDCGAKVVAAITEVKERIQGLKATGSRTGPVPTATAVGL